VNARGTSLSWRVFIANAVVLCVAAAILLISPVTVSHPVSAREAAVVVGGLCVMVVLNLWLVRRTLQPLNRLADDMDRIDLLEDESPAIAPPPSGDEELVRLASSYEAMLDRLRFERRESARRTAQAQEEERRHVARELHDQVGQVLTGLVLQIDRVMADLDPAARDRLVPVREAARGALQDVRAIARSLRPDVLDDLGLVPALQGLATRFARDTGIPVERRLAPVAAPLGRDAELAVYRIAQEALTNVARHAGAGRVELRLEPLDGGVTLSVSDDGRGVDGLDPPAAGGLRWMRERAVLVDASLAVRNEPEGGTTVSLHVPGSSVAA
jgi:two-component system sensor histidine kinase UhpB